MLFVLKEKGGGEMQTEARVGVVVEGGGLNTTSSVVVEPRRQSQIGTASQLLAGGVAGAVSKTCTAPLARLTILFQDVIVSLTSLIEWHGSLGERGVGVGVDTRTLALVNKPLNLYCGNLINKELMIQGMHADASSLEKASIWREASKIVREEGVMAFWKGNLVTIAHRLPYSSISFYAFERYKNLLQVFLGVESPGENISADLCIRLVGGGLAGITAASVTYPLDLVRTRLAAQRNVIYYRGMCHALHTISKEKGFVGLYKGLGATLLGVGPNLAISFSVYDTARSYWHFHRPEDSTVLVSLACGSLSGIASSTVAYPLDLVRRRMQLEGAGGRARVYKTGLIGTFGHIIKTEGLRGLYRGILPEYYKVVPSVGIVFMTYEKLKQVLSSIPES
ncbi:hypothetical protein BUALT_Bualt06G0049200 [Buddleja alternifolia]|uniref:Mitochondrial carrier protein n=1 Tax=Buddleja alternifolia TaxID=168488 RepID=A0AAV6XJJ7_9LAMI|nr:hypothetical protein BUALT_Bualt06G0049200 [Buddleja alternifolia]